MQSRGLVWDTAGAGAISGVAVLVATVCSKLWPVAVELIVPVHGKRRVGISQASLMMRCDLIKMERWVGRFVDAGID